MRLNFSSLLFIVLVIAVGAFVTAPWWTFRSMRDAARTQDVPALAQMIDYRAVRDSLDAQISGRQEEPPPPDLMKDPIGALTEGAKKLLEPKPTPPPETTGYLAPKALAALADGRPPADPLPQGKSEPFPMIAFWGPDRCRIVVTDPLNKARKTEFTFQRHGLYTWKLARILLPQGSRL